MSKLNYIFFLPLRWQARIILSSALLIPFIAFALLNLSQNALIDTRTDRVEELTQLLTKILDNKVNFAPASPVSTEVYVPYRTPPLTLDGYAPDWARQYSTTALSNSTTLSLTNRNQQLWMLIDIKSKQLNLPMNETVMRSGLYITITADQKSWDLYSSAPGRIQAINKSDQTDYRVAGILRATKNGYRYEITLPKALAHSHLRIKVMEKGQSIWAQSPRFKLVYETPSLLKNIQNLTLSLTNKQIFLVDSQGWVRARTSATNEISDDIINHQLIGYWLRQHIEERNVVNVTGNEVINHEMLEQSLNGEVASRWVQYPNKPFPQRVSIAPIQCDHSHCPALIIVDNMNNLIPKYWHKAFLFVGGILCVAIAIILLSVAWASIHARRIKQLIKENELFLTKHNLTTHQSSGFKDEIARLTESQNWMKLRIEDQTKYLEQLASRLTHELKTPISVIASSLEGMTFTELSQAQSEQLDRAHQGVANLRHIFSALSEARSLEYALQHSEPNIFEVGELLTLLHSSYQQLYPNVRFELQLNSTMSVTGSEDQFAQALHKLIDNAVSFHTIDTPIIITLDSIASTGRITVNNEGPSLPNAEIFDPFTSIREYSGHSQHLGFGLYMVKLIANHHGGAVLAENKDGGVRIGWTFEPTLSS